jgi:23S rRNA (cytosine1962-C5)-methyltransferase
MVEKKVILKPGKEKALLKQHPWIFSGAVDRLPAFENGEILSVYSAEGQFLAKAYFHTQNSIAGRILTFVDEPIEAAIEKRIDRAIALRDRLFDRERTNAFRLINAEGDELPGLIADLYDDVLVMQINTCGMAKLRPLLIELLCKKLNLKGILEKSLSPSRRLEGLNDCQEVLYGDCPKEVVVKENGLLFLVPIQEGQKTGFFLDQREMRQSIAKHAVGKKVLNCFSYTGGFSLFALQAGAALVTSVDSSEAACHIARENTLLNHLSVEQHKIVLSDVFDFLQSDPLLYDLIILDPPAFVKKRSDVDQGCRGYKELNRRALEKMPKGSLLLTCSCSHFIDPALFQNLLFQAALEAKRSVKIVSRHLQAADHPVSLFHPEGDYLKSLLLHVD